MAEWLKHLKLLEENIVEFAEGDSAADGDYGFHGVDAKDFLDGFVKLLAEDFQIFLRQRKARRHGVAAETDERIGADTEKIDQIQLADGTRGTSELA